MKQVTVFGASGKVGQLVVELLLENDYSVNAFTYGEFEHKDNRVLVTQGDIHSYDYVHKALVGSEAVISTLGSWHTPTKDILSAGMRNIIPAMQDLDIKRIVSLTGADAWTLDERPSLFRRLTHVLLKLVAPKILRDGEEHMRLLSQSNLDWTVVRSPVMTDGHSADYKLQETPLLPWTKIERKNVAKSIIGQLNDTRFLKKAPFIKQV